jgi:hypothetical protein
MKHTRTQTIFLFLFIAIAAGHLLNAQPGCKLKDPIVHIDFGLGSNVREFNATAHANYERVKDNCPPDGFYSYTSYTSSCFNNDWFTLNGDHTANGGNMMLVNASESGGSFFNSIISDLSENTTYEFAVWFMNVCRINGGCSPLPPNIIVTLITFTGRKVAEFETGELTQSASPQWKKYSAYFTTPPGETMLGLTMTNMTTGGCGNDFAMDDITVRECIKPEPISVRNEKPISAKTAKPEEQEVTKPIVAKPMPTVQQPIKKDTVVLIARQPASTTPKTVTPPAAKNPATIALPVLLVKRENPIIKTIKTTAGEMTIDLYDNGQIDGDTVTVYHNNQLMVSRAGLSQKPVSFHITIDAKEPHHELVMVANNLGSIPPNTSLMILRIKDKRYDVFISSSEQKNAKLVIDLEE